MDHSNDIGLVNDSLERCTSRRAFFGDFYERFVASAPEIAARFADTDMKAQAKALKLGFYLLLSAVGGEPDAWQRLEMRAVRHNHKHLDIAPWMYDAWIECLLESVREFDDLSDATIEAAWRNVMQKGIDFMVSHY